MNQRDKIVKLLQDANGEYVGGSIMDRISSQFNTRLKELKEKGHIIVTTKEKDEFGFFQHRLVKNPPIMHNKEKKLETLTQQPLFDLPLIKDLQIKIHQDY